MRRARTWLARLSLLCAGFVVGAAAVAGNIRGSWDPQFNNTFTGVGFRGEIVFFVPDPCLSGPPSTTQYRDDAACSTLTHPNGMSFVDAEVVLYDYPDTSQVQSTIDFGSPLPSPDPILGILVQYDANGVGTVIGLDTSLIGPQFSNQTPGPYFETLPELFPEELFLQFASGHPDSPNVGLLSEGGAYLLPVACAEDLCGADYEARSNRGVVAFVPEPGSLALLLSAMGVGWLARRRTAAR